MITILISIVLVFVVVNAIIFMRSIRIFKKAVDKINAKIFVQKVIISDETTFYAYRVNIEYSSTNVVELSHIKVLDDMVSFGGLYGVGDTKLEAIRNLNSKLK